MKLAPLLTQYLYSQKELKLTGIGVFTIDPSFIPEPETGKHPKTTIRPDIYFEYNPLIKEDEDLVNWIAQQTGKMKSLTSADLNSHLEQARQFLNIGKPFLIEGIGTLLKSKSGHFEFISGNQLIEKTKDERSRDAELTSSSEESFSDYEEMFSPKKTGTPAGKKFTLVFFIAVGLALAVWGGYRVYKNSLDNKSGPVEQQQKQQTASVPDTTSQKKDSALQVITPPAQPGTYRFVIEQSPKQRALYRFGQLKSFGLNIKLDSTNSVLYKLYFVLPATPADTLRIRDSLSVWYVNPVYMKGGKARIEL